MPSDQLPAFGESTLVPRAVCRPGLTVAQHGRLCRILALQLSGHGLVAQAQGMLGRQCALVGLGRQRVMRARRLGLALQRVRAAS